MNLLITLLVTFTVQSIYITGKGFEGYIFPKEHPVLLSIEEYERYTPTEEDIHKAETILMEKIKKANASRENQFDSCPIIHNSLKKYTRQYVGFINKEDEKVLWVNMIWRKNFPQEELSEDIVVVKDGCSYYWSVKIDLHSKKLYDLNINGSA